VDTPPVNSLHCKILGTSVLVSTVGLILHFRRKCRCCLLYSSFNRRRGCLIRSFASIIRYTAACARVFAPDATTGRISPGVDWAPDTCQVGRLICRPGGPPRQMLKEGVIQRRGPLAREGCRLINYLQGNK